nr:FISUMP domain-containing protein [uncultured Bacteroides sp.]
MKTAIYHSHKIVSTVWLSIILLSGCGQSEIENLLPGEGESNSGEPVELRISLADPPEYSNEQNGESPSTRSGEPLVAEWVKVNSFSATRSADEYEGPAIAAMELFEDTTSTTPQTRNTMTTGYYFRLIAFKKSGSSYVFQSVADYTANGANAPVWKQGNMAGSKGQTYRFVAYSFNNATPLGALPGSYTWNSTAISIPDLKNDFLTFDSGDQTLTGESYTLPITFTHQLCRLTVKISAAGFDSNTFTNCTGVYIKQGGNSSSWTVGATGVAANTNNTATFDIADNNTTTFCSLVPFAAARAITVHFGTLSVGGKTADNTDITSSQSVQLLAGRSYTMTVQFKYKPGTQVPESDINLTKNGCTDQDKIDLAKLTWADGNIMGTGLDNYEWSTPTGYGYYYPWMSIRDGNTNIYDTDPCSKLNATKYGTGWRLPTALEFYALRRCSGQSINGGMWFMNESKGLFLPAGGQNPNGAGFATSVTYEVGKRGYYWSGELQMTGYAVSLEIGTYGWVTSEGAQIKSGLNVRCVK